VKKTLKLIMILIIFAIADDAMAMRIARGRMPPHSSGAGRVKTLHKVAKTITSKFRSGKDD
jgi:hypothetical protein